MSLSAKGPPTPPPTPPPAGPAAPPRERSVVFTCHACGLRSRSALMVKSLSEGRGRCVNTAACEKRQRKLAKGGTS